MKIETYIFHTRRVFELQEFLDREKEYLESMIEGAKANLERFNSAKNDIEKLNVIHETTYRWGDDGLIHILSDDGTMRQDLPDRYEPNPPWIPVEDKSEDNS